MRSDRLLALLLLGTLPAPAVAQDAAAWRDSAQRILGELHALSDSLTRRDSTVADVGRRGDLAIAASPNQAGLAPRLLEHFGQQRDRWFGHVMPSPGGFRIVVRTEQRRAGFGYSVEREVGSVVLTGLPDTGNAVRTYVNASPEHLDAVLLDQYSAMMFAALPAAVARWLVSAPPLSAPEDARRDIAMYALVTGTGHDQRRCVTGDIAACAYVLSLRPSPNADPGGRFAPFMRADLLLTALSVGGPEGWLRLQHGAGPDVETALAAAAGIPIDSLLDRWRGELLARRPEEAPIEGPGVGVAVAWIAVLLAGALGASRWA